MRSSQTPILQAQTGVLARVLGPVHMYPDIFESATFSFRIRLPFTRIRRIRQRIRIFLTPLSRGEKINRQRNRYRVVG